MLSTTFCKWDPYVNCGIAEFRHRRAVGGVVETAPADSVSLNFCFPRATLTHSQDVEDEATALANYDRKVHTACTEMVRSIASELSALGVPFFAIQSSLIGNDSEGECNDRIDLGSNKPASGTPLTPKTLRGLQKRMLEHLEDLCEE